MSGEFLILLIGALALMLVGLALNLIGAPGSVLIWLAALGFAWLSGWTLAWWHLVVLLLLAVLAEALEFLGGLAGAHAFGVSRRGMSWAVAGTLLGMLAAFLTFMPLMIFIGLLLGGLLGEYREHKKWGKAFQGAAGIITGKIGGIIAKSVIAVAMILYFLIAVALKVVFTEGFLP